MQRFKYPSETWSPLEGQALAIFQESLKDMCYILIDEMSFVGPRLLASVDERLRQVSCIRETNPLVVIPLFL